VNVGRQRQDFNGDGYGDLVVATGGFLQVGSEDVYFGGAPGGLPSTPGWTVAGDQTTAVGGQAVWAGDLDGDGFPDLAFVAARWNGAYLLRVYAGGAVPGTSPAVEIEDVDGIWSPRWISDVNGDGFDDLLFLRSSTAPTEELLLGGRPIGAGLARELFLPVPSGNLLAIGDIDHDGNGELLRILPGAISRLIWAGTEIADRPIALPPDVQGMTPVGYLGDPLGRGGATMLFSDSGQRPRAATLVEPADSEAERCDADLTFPPGSPPEQSPVVALGDIDGDGQDDFAIGYPLVNNVRLYFGACGFGRALDLPGPAPPDPAGPVPKQRNGDFVASPGDMDGDGFPELAVSSRWFGIDAAGGQVYLYRGGPSVGAAPAVILPSASRSPEGFAASVD
jgi:FG-GAP repeat